MVLGITHYYKRLKFYDKIIFWSGCILFCYPQSHICLRWRKLIIPVYVIFVRSLNNKTILVSNYEDAWYNLQVRKAAQEGVCIVLKGSLFMTQESPPPHHPAASLTTKHCIQLIEGCGGRLVRMSGPSVYD